MKIIIPIKQVPNTTEIKIDPVTNRIIREGVESIINPFDTYAIEEGIRMKERFGGETIVISMGPPQAESALREALSLGIDKAILLSDEKFAGSDTLATAYTLATAIKEKVGDFDLIICGKEAMDGSTGQVGPELAENLGLPQISYVSKIKDIKDKKIVAQRLMEDHYEVIESPVPLLITVVKEINEPRLPSLKGMLRAKREEIIIYKASDLEENGCSFGIDASPTRVIKIWRPERAKEGVMLNGEPDEVAEKLYAVFKEKNLI